MNSLKRQVHTSWPRLNSSSRPTHQATLEGRGTRPTCSPSAPLGTTAGLSEASGVRGSGRPARPLLHGNALLVGEVLQGPLAARQA